MSKLAFVFPGQGSQIIGMGMDAYAASPIAKKIFDDANALLPFDLVDIIQNGSDEDLKASRVAQPALVTTSSALLALVKEAGITADYVAGHSLGEYSALVAANVLTSAEAAQLVNKRGELMEDAATGAMAAVMGTSEADLEAILETARQQSGEIVQLANLNCPGQIVISGSVAGIEAAQVAAKEAGVKRVIPLKVSGPFHSELMAPAAEAFASLLGTATFSDASTPVITNVDATPTTLAADFKVKLEQQLTAPVQWINTMAYLIEQDVDTIIEIGPGKVLAGLMKKMDRSVTVHNVHDLETLEATLAILGGK